MSKLTLGTVRTLATVDQMNKIEAACGYWATKVDPLRWWKSDGIRYVIDTRVDRNTRAKRRVGQCNPMDQSINIHTAICTPEHRHFFDETFMHEVAHMIVAVYCRKGGHGDEWKLTMKMLGLAPEVCASAEKSAVTRSTLPYLVTCTKCDLSVGRHRVSKDIRTRRSRHGGGCGGDFIVTRVA